MSDWKWRLTHWATLLIWVGPHLFMWNTVEFSQRDRYSLPSDFITVNFWMLSPISRRPKSGVYSLYGQSYACAHNKVLIVEMLSTSRSCPTPERYNRVVQDSCYKKATHLLNKPRSHAVSTKRTILSPFTKEYRVLAANSGIRLFLEGFLLLGKLLKLVYTFFVYAQFELWFEES